MERNPETLTPTTGLRYKINTFRFQFTRKLLHYWIKPNVLGCDTQSLLPDADSLVCFVLPYRSLADLLVIDHACEQAALPRPYLPINDGAQNLESRSFFFLGRPEGILGRRSLRKNSDRMVRLFDHQEALQQSIRKQTIKIVPVSLFWGHQPDREKSIFKLLLSENWNVTNKFKKLLAIVFHPRHILVQFSKPVSLAELMSTTEDRGIQIRKLSRILRVHFNRQRQAILGPDLSHRRTLINSMITSTAVKEAIKEEARITDLTPDAIEKKAIGYAKNIVSHQTYRVIRFFYVLLTWLWNKLYDGIDVSNIEIVKELARENEILYIPCHRSHIDYLLLSYVLYMNGLTPPHIAAGDNLNLPIVGPMLRRAGAFFMRRSFKGDLLYKAVFDEYLHLMFIKGYSVEFFIEGGRSRTGRTQNPRTGMINMTLNSLQRNSSLPIVLMPVYFGYERILEVGTYVGELKGQSKKNESLLDIFRVLKILKHNFGKVMVNFGEPIKLQPFMDDHLTNWKSPEQINPNDFFKTCTKLSQLLVTNINNAVALNPVNLIATIILATPKQTIEEDKLKLQLDTLIKLLEMCPYSLHTSITSMSIDEMITHSEKMSAIERIHYPFGDILTASAEVSVLLTYYRNNVAHVFMMPSLIARYIKFRGKTSEVDILDFCNRIYPYLRAEYFLPWHADDIADLCRDLITALQKLGLIRCENDQISAPEPMTEPYVLLTDLGEIVEPVLERYYLACALLESGSFKSLSEVENAASAVAARLSAIYGINSPEFFDKSLFTSFINVLKEQGHLQSEASEIITRKSLREITARMESLLDTGIGYNALQAIEQLPHKNIP